MDTSWYTVAGVVLSDLSVLSGVRGWRGEERSACRSTVESLIGQAGRWRAAEEISKAAAELRRLSEHTVLRSPSELPEEEVALIADKSVHRVRKALARERDDQPKAPPPTEEEIQEWERRREDRRKREAS